MKEQTAVLPWSMPSTNVPMSITERVKELLISLPCCKVISNKEKFVHNINWQKLTVIFISSPERKVLMVSYCDRAVSIVYHASSTFYLVYALEATFSVQSSWNLVRMFGSIKSETTSKLGHVGSKTRSLSQILEKPCVRSRSHIFSPILMKLGQNVCPDEISDEFEIGSCGVKN